jgi:transposase
MDATTSSVGVESPSKELALRQEASLLVHVEEQMKETTKVLMNTLDKRMKQDTGILCSMKEIGENTAMNFLIELGGAVEIYENDKKLIAASGLDPSTYESGKYAGKSRISKRGNKHMRRVIWLMATRVIINNDLSRHTSRNERKMVCPIRKQSWPQPINLIRTFFVMLSRKAYFVEGGIKYS